LLRPAKPYEASDVASANRQGGKARPCKNVALSDEERPTPGHTRGATSLRDVVAAGEALGRCRDGGGGGRPHRGRADRARPPDRRLQAGTDSRCPAPRAPCRRSPGRSATPPARGAEWVGEPTHTRRTERRGGWGIAACAAPAPCRPLSSRGKMYGKAPPPWAKHQRMLGQRSSPPPKITRVMQSAVSRGNPAIWV